MAKKIQVELSVKDKGTKEVKKFSDSAGSALKTLAGPLVAGAVIGAFTSMAKNVLTLGDQLDKMSQRTGFSVEQLDKLRQAAILGGTSLETVERAIRKLQRNLIDASRGLGTATKTFDEMGISINKVLALDSETQFRVIAQAILDIEDPTKRAAAAQELLGISGTNLIPILKDVAGGLRDYNAQISQDQAENIAAFNDNISKLKENLIRLTADAIGPAVEKLNDYFAITAEAARLEDQIKLDELNTQLRKQKELLEEIGPPQEGYIDRARLERENVEAGIRATEAEIKALEEKIEKKKEENKVTEESIDIKKDENEETQKTKEQLEKETKARQAAIDKIKKQVEETRKAAETIRENRKRELGVNDEDFAEFITGFGGAPGYEKENKDEEEAQTEHYDHMLEMQKKHIEDMIAEDQRAAQERQDLYRQMAEGISQSIIDPLIEASLGAKDFKEAFREMAISILKQLAAIAIMKAIAGMFGGGAGGGGAAVPYIPALAMGGIVKGGLKGYAGGGIVDKPTVAMIGEGSQNEAVVPLPNGSEIPVDMKGKEEPRMNNFYIQAVDAPSLVNLLRRNPEAVVRPLTEQIERGNQGLRQNLKRAVNK